MAARRTQSARSDEPSGPADDDQPVLVRRRPLLPNGRALMGGFLVVVAALAAMGVHEHADRRADTRFVAAARPVRPGQQLSADDLRLVAAALPADTAATGFTDPAAVLPATALAPLEPGQLVTSAAVRPDRNAGDTQPSVELSLAIERAAALDGALVAAERVDVLATYGTGPSAFTTRVARQAQLRAVGSVDDGLGGSGQVALTLALHPDEVLAVAHAARAAGLTIVRSVGGPPDSAEGAAGEGDRYRPDAGTGAADPGGAP